MQDKAALAELCYIIVADFTLCNRFELGEQSDKTSMKIASWPYLWMISRTLAWSHVINEATGSLAWLIVAYKNSVIYKSTDS